MRYALQPEGRTTSVSIEDSRSLLVEESEDVLRVLFAEDGADAHVAEDGAGDSGIQVLGCGVAAAAVGVELFAAVVLCGGGFGWLFCRGGRGRRGRCRGLGKGCAGGESGDGENPNLYVHFDPPFQVGKRNL